MASSISSASDHIITNFSLARADLMHHVFDRSCYSVTIPANYLLCLSASILH